MQHEMREIRSELLGESYFEVIHPTGLKILLAPMKQCRSSFAVFGAKYGSVDNCFRVSGSPEIRRVPAGIAHYLEHKMFECEEGNVDARFAATGAAANAYTSFDSTCYLFSCTENFCDSLEILLDFVQRPYFTKETVQKEQGIIGQEIRMYDDTPQWRVLFNLLRAMYRVNPVRIDIAGTTESIAEITPELLYECCGTFYNLNNMVLSVAGNADPDQVLDVCDRMLKPSRPVSVERIFEPEPEEVSETRAEQKMSVASPLFELGFKESVTDGRADSAQLAATDILLEAIASPATPLYRRLLDAGLINEATFGSEYFEGAGFASVIFGGESKNPDAVEDAILSELGRVRREGISRETFRRARNTVYGKYLEAMNLPGNVANSLISLSFSGREMYAYLSAVAEASEEQVLARLETQLRPERAVLSVVLPEQAC
jgi:predicted Zn-dependent peptidase